MKMQFLGEESLLRDLQKFVSIPLPERHAIKFTTKGGTGSAMVFRKEEMRKYIVGLQRSRARAYKEFGEHLSKAIAEAERSRFAYFNCWGKGHVLYSFCRDWAVNRDWAFLLVIFPCEIAIVSEQEVETVEVLREVI